MVVEINYPPASSGGPFPGGTDGSVLFVHPAGFISQDPPNFLYDSTNHILSVDNLFNANAGFGLTLQALNGAGTAAADGVSIIGGSGSSGNGAGGSIVVTAGNGAGTGQAGSVTFNAGTPTNASGRSVNFNASSGVGTNKNGGDVVFTAGNATGIGIAGGYKFTGTAGGTGKLQFTDLGSNQTFSFPDATGRVPIAPTMTAGSIPYFSSSNTQLEDNANFFWDGTNQRLGIFTNTPPYEITLGLRTNTIGVQNQGVNTTAGNALILRSGGGGTSGSGAAGGGFIITTGSAGGDDTVTRNGGQLSIGVGSSKGDGAAAIAVNGGTGGVGTGTAGATGGNITITAGTGGIGSATSGNGGSASLIGGTGGAGTVGGNGGQALMRGGTAGGVAGAAGGTLALQGGSGSVVGSGGAGGSLSFLGGAAQGDNTVNRAGGLISFSAGSSKGSSIGAVVNINGGVGGAGTGTAGAAGGDINFSGGLGGTGSLTNGAGGAIVFKTTPDNSAVATRMTIAATGAISITNVTATIVPFAIKAASGQSGNLTEWQNSSATPLTVVDASGNLGIGTSAPAARLHLGGNISAASWTTNGIALRFAAGTYTDTTSSGTVATEAINAVSGSTLAASSSTTFTNAASLYIGAAPTAGTNVTITNGWTLQAAGKVKIDDYLLLGTSSSLTPRSILYMDSGTRSQAYWGGSNVGYYLYQAPRTVTDTSSSGTVTSALSNSFGQITLAASSTTTYTDSATLYISDAPAAGSNVTLTNAWAQWIDAGNVRYDGKFGVYNNVTVKGFGVPALVEVLNLTAQAADITTTNLANSGTAGLYRVCYSLQDTAADITAGSVTLTISYTDGAGSTTATATQVLTGVGRQSGTVFIQLASGNITYATSHTGLFGTATYALYITCERLN